MRAFSAAFSRILVSCLLGATLAIGVGSCTSDPAPTTREAVPTSLPARLVLPIGNGAFIETVLIPAGTFVMGSPEKERDREPDEGPQREVVISSPFYMGVYEVTQRQYEAVMGRNPSRFRGPDRPVEGIWWEDAAQFCRIVSERSGRVVRLPTEAEWEYACRAGTTTRFSFGDSYGDLPAHGNYCDRSNTTTAPWRDVAQSDGHDQTAPVGSHKPNPWGLFDMHGNVFEWCIDWYRDSYAGAARTDPQGPPHGPYHVLRGGSWYSPPWMCRSAYRHRFTADGRFNHLIGFRIVVEAKPPIPRTP